MLVRGGMGRSCGNSATCHERLGRLRAAKVLCLHTVAHLWAGLANDAPEATKKLVETKEGQLNGAIELAHDICARFIACSTAHRCSRQCSLQLQLQLQLQLLHLKPHEIGHGVRHGPRAEERGQFALARKPTEEATNDL